MRTKMISLEKAQNFLAQEMDEPEESRRDETVKLIRTAMEQELTERQRECVELYFFRHMTMEETGRMLGIGKGTVCRHLQKSRARLGRALSYAGFRRA